MIMKKQLYILLFLPFVCWGQHYVRPSGGSYGTEDGSSYANAWDGFTNIEWDSLAVSTDTLFICGQHYELLTVASDSFLIYGGYVADTGIINGQLTRDCLHIEDKNNVIITELTLDSAVVSGLWFKGICKNIVTNYVILSNSGNQGAQHLGSVYVTHNYLETFNNVDDGVSGHDSCYITLNYANIHDNREGINVIEKANVISNYATFSNNTLYDIWATTSTDERSSLIEVRNSTTSQNILADNGAKVILRDCAISDTLMLAGASDSAFIDLHNCTVTGRVVNNLRGFLSCDSTIITGLLLLNDGASDFRNCLLTNIQDTDIDGATSYTDCYISDISNYAGTVTANRTLFIGGTGHQFDVVSGGSGIIKYCVFKYPASGKFGVTIRTGGTATIDNCNFIGNSNVGRGVFMQENTTINNCIISDLQYGIYNDGGTTVIANNCDIYNNTTDIIGTVTQNSCIAVDPLYTDVVNNDFTLISGSLCIGKGKVTSFSTGIDIANWGNGTNQIPIIETKEQVAPWTIGAYVIEYRKLVKDGNNFIKYNNQMIIITNN